MSGNLFIICAPSGAGKTSLVAELLRVDAGIRLSISYTTRAPRPGEVDGRDYHFVTPEHFEQMAANGEFLESANVYGYRYGTSQTWIDAQRVQGQDILLEIDWQGAQQVRKLMPAAISIYILPPSIEVLTERLNKRAQDSAEVIAKRLAAARADISHVAEFDYVIINQAFSEAAQDLISIVRAQRLRATAQLARHNALINQMK